MDPIAGDIAKRYKNIILDGFDPVSSGGFTQVPNFILKSKDLSVGAKLAYATLLSYAWHNDYCYPGQEKLSVDMGVSDRSVRTYLKELEKGGLLAIKQKGLGKTNEYRLFATVQKKRI